MGQKLGQAPPPFLEGERGPHLTQSRLAKAYLQFSVHICCGQMAAWIKMVLHMVIGLSPGDFVLNGDPARPLNFRPMFIIVIVIKSLIVLNLFRYAQLHHIVPIPEVGVAN